MCGNYLMKQTCYWFIEKAHEYELDSENLLQRNYYSWYENVKKILEKLYRWTTKKSKQPRIIGSHICQPIMHVKDLFTLEHTPV